MVSSVENISEQIFKIIKGFGHDIVLFTDNGKKTVDPTEARRFYAKDIQMMVNLVVDETTNEMVVNLSQDTDLDAIKPMLSSLRNLANRYIIEYTVKTFGKSVEPKDFSYMAKQIEEGFSGWHGSARKSINELGDAKLIVRHKRSVDEEKRGARTRQIESIFIENADGERFKFPSRNITAAKAMLRHVREGGAPFDEFGQHIYGLMEELNQLKVFNRKNKRNDFFEDAAIGEEIGSRINSLRTNLKQISGQKGYKTHFESFVKEQSDVSAEKLDELKSAVTINYFDESIADSLPYVARVIENMRTRQGKEKTINDFAKLVLNSKDGIALNRPIDDTDPESPAARSFNDPATECAAWISYLAPRMKDDHLANKMMEIADLVHVVSPQHLKMAAAAIKVIRQNAQVAEANDIGEEKVAIDEEEISKITESFAKYNVRKIFGA